MSDEWISCEDRLPDDPGIYEVLSQYDGMVHEVFAARNGVGKMVWVIPDRNAITHWRPKAIQQKDNEK